MCRAVPGNCITGSNCSGCLPALKEMQRSVSVAFMIEFIHDKISGKIYPFLRLPAGFALAALKAW